MTAPAPWQCPSCSTWLAPHVTEHRCDPPEAGVTAAPSGPGSAGSTGTSISTATLPGTVTCNVTGYVISGRDLAAAVQRELLWIQQANRRWPPRAA